MHSSTQHLAIKKGSSTQTDATAAARELHAALHQPAAALILFFCSPEYDLKELGDELRRLFGDSPLIGCTTAGEITPEGYLQGAITGVSLGSPAFDCALTSIESLNEFELDRGARVAATLLGELNLDDSEKSQCFALMFADGLSMQEEPVSASIFSALKGIPLIGGSAGDGETFRETNVYIDGSFGTNRAVFALIRSRLPFEVFKTENFVGGNAKLVVTAAHPDERRVTELNGLPAGHEYARVIGIARDKLTPMIFANHPVVIRMGGEYYVRAIQRLNEDGSLSFFCAIQEGLVLTVASPTDMLTNLSEAFDKIRSKMGEPQLIIGCDCLHRRLEAEHHDALPDISELMRKNHVIGFATYGEQYNGMHVNQTMTGVAIGAERSSKS